MAFTEAERDEARRALEGYLERRRPPEEIRDELDIGVRIEDQGIVIFEIRPAWRQPGAKAETPVAKTTYVRAKKTWKVYWMRRDLRWHPYGPVPQVESLDAFLRLVDEDEYGCFWG